MKTENICKCGHRKEEHLFGKSDIGLEPCHHKYKNPLDICPCKKFTPELHRLHALHTSQNQTRQDSVNMHGSTKQDVRWNSEPTAENNQSPEIANRNIVEKSTLDTHNRGIFDTTYLDKQSDNTKDEDLFQFLQGRIRERQRLKTEVEKILDELTCKVNYGLGEDDFIVPVEELKKRLGI